ncbi:hypothetical protein ACM01_12460 [Streptomyces viridochromogenes]|uniref:Uncharacterized protein n=1 Tax=Streptomyces viridochromogenes TaxID=1938 RepID=A0A0J8CA44_STRVR|nr:hypothetical protein ACM01_12460 [Streptomyces viridochromogenes]KOG14794.1 hypothetical protein ADK36_30005 [Streptomyces viridochromogenes]KOG14988.1 hypothetical protein ADK35_29650 [Streptomyces viridochromogenes]
MPVEFLTDEQAVAVSTPDRRIDAAFATPGGEVLGCGIPTDLPEAILRAAGDHLPVPAALRVPASG